MATERAAIRRATFAACARSCVTELGVAFPKGGLSGIRHCDPFRIRRRVGDVAIVPVPPLVRPLLRVALGRVLPNLLTTERRHIEVAPDGAHRLVATAVDEVGPENALTVAEERVVTMPLIDTEVGVEVVGYGVPGHVPAHPRFQSLDVVLRCP